MAQHPSSSRFGIIFFNPKNQKKKQTQEVQRLQMELAARFLGQANLFWRWFWKGGERRKGSQTMRLKGNMRFKGAGDFAHS